MIDARDLGHRRNHIGTSLMQRTLNELRDEREAPQRQAAALEAIATKREPTIIMSQHMTNREAFGLGIVCGAAGTVVLVHLTLILLAFI